MPSPPPAPLPPPSSSREAGGLKIPSSLKCNGYSGLYAAQWIEGAVSTRHLSANEKSFRFLAGRLLLPVDKESVSSYFGTPLLFIFAWLIMGIITKEPLFFENLNRAGKHVLQHKNNFLRPTSCIFPQKAVPLHPQWISGSTYLVKAL